MRLLFGFLLILSIVFFVVMQWGGELAGETKNAQLLAELNPEKIILLDMPAASHVNASAALGTQSAVAASVPEAVSAPASSVAAPVAASAPLPASAPAKTVVRPASSVAAALPGRVTAKAAVLPLPAATAAVPVVKVAADSCKEWGEFSGADLTRATQALETLHLGERMVRRTVEYTSGYWVYMPPLKSKAAVNRKIAEIKALGVEDFYVVHEPPRLVNVISLGVFKTREAAKNALASLQKKGIRTAIVGERKRKLKFILFEFKGIDADAAASLSRLQKEYAYSELKTVACKRESR